MKVITPGHRYEVENFDRKSRVEPNQHIQFIEKEASIPGSSQLYTIHNGTTNEELLRVLIDRLAFLGEKLPSRESAIAKTKLEEALMWLEKRTAERRARGVEGTIAS